MLFKVSTNEVLAMLAEECLALMLMMDYSKSDGRT